VISPGLAFAFLLTFLIGFIIGGIVRNSATLQQQQDAMEVLAEQRIKREKEFKAQRILVKLVDTGQVARLRATVIFMEILDYIHGIWEVEDG